MERFKSFVEPDYLSDAMMMGPEADMLVEKLITFGGKAYPKFGNVVILAGGAGSGKGFTIENLLGIDGMTFDVDALKLAASKMPLIRKRVKKELGVDIEKLGRSLKDPDNVFKLHTIIGDHLKLDDRKMGASMNGIISADPSRKPNLIFDVTMKNISKLRGISQNVTDVGYKKENVHIVWVLNSIDVALQQNRERDRMVPEDVLVQTHQGVSITMEMLLKDAGTLRKYMDGDLWVTANLKFVDSTLKSRGKNDDTFAGDKIGFKGNTKGGGYVTDANYFKLKAKGKPPVPMKNIDKILMKKIQDYTPVMMNWDRTQINLPDK